MSVLPFGRSGVISASMLGLGRALGETMAVATVLSPSFLIHASLLDPGGGTFAQNIASKFGEADEFGRDALIASGLVLFVITLLVNGAARADHRPPQGVLGGQRMSNAAISRRAPASSPAAGASAAALVARGRSPPAPSPWPSASASSPGWTARVQWGLIAALLFVVVTYVASPRRRGQPPGQGPARHQPGLGRASCSPSSRWSPCCGRPSARGVEGPRRLLPDPLDGRGRRLRAGRRHLPRAHRHPGAGRPRHGDRRADRSAHRGLPRRVRPRAGSPRPSPSSST